MVENTGGCSVDIVRVLKKKKHNKNSKKSSTPQLSSSTFAKKFYAENSETSELTVSQVSHFRTSNLVKLYGLQDDEDIKPVLSFSAMASSIPDDRCLKSCSTFTKPTPIQSQCWPILASGHDVIGIAETGSGKTLAFGVPGLTHLIGRMKNPISDISNCPMMLVVAPTRELAMQSHEVLSEAGRSCNITSICIYGGVPKHDQRRSLSSKYQIIVATPGRLIDLMNEGHCDLSGVSYLVLDEADRMLDQGFERDIRTIISQTHSERQTCLFSATWPDSIRQLAHEFLANPIKVTIGSEDLAAGKNVRQIVEVVEDRSRMKLLKNLLSKYHKEKNRILIFVLYKKEADRVCSLLRDCGWKCAPIHGDMTQACRTQSLMSFKKGHVPLLIATDVAARGLDIPDVEYVINYSFPLTIEDYVHRIGRTGRAGKHGISHTFFHDGDKARAGELVNLLKSSGQEVPKDLFRFDLCVKRKQHKLYGAFGPQDQDDDRPMKKSTRIVFDD